MPSQVRIIEGKKTIWVSGVQLIRGVSFVRPPPLRSSLKNIVLYILWGSHGFLSLFVLFPAVLHRSACFHGSAAAASMRLLLLLPLPLPAE